MRYTAALEAKALAAKFMNDNKERAATDLIRCTPGGGMGLPQDAIDDLVSVTQHMINEADTYFWSDEITKLIMFAAESLSNDSVYKELLLPSQSGFMWLEYKPLLTLTDRKVHLSAISWCNGSLGIVLIGWLSFEGQFGIAPMVVAPVQDGLSVKDLNGDKDITFCYKAFLSMLLFLEQQLLEVAEGYADRATQRRLSKTYPHAHDPIQIITLRRPRHNKAYEEEVDRRHVEWQCQWMVRGHWRHYKNKQIWIFPYVKGPDDKPLKITEKILAVIR